MNNLTQALIIITIVFFLMPLFITETRSSNFNVTPMNIHFIGSVCTSKNIIAYGDNGACLMTTDQGKSWKQYSMHPYGEIRKIVNFKDTLWGVIDEGFIVKSTDHGFTWDKYKFEPDSADKLIYIIVNENSVYIRSKFSVYQFNRELELLNSFSDEMIELNKITYNIPEEAPAYYFHYDKLYYLNKQIIIPLSYADQGMLVLSNDLKENKFIDLEEILEKRFIDTLNFYELRGIIYYNGKPVLNINRNLYYANDDFTEWSYFFKDTTYMNREDSLFQRKYGSFVGDYYVINNELYYNKPFDNKSNRGFDDLGITKYYSNPLDTFKLINNLFKNKYYTVDFSGVGKGSLDGIRDVLYNSDLTVFQDSVIVLAGWNKSLLQTRDLGKSWKLISYLSGKPEVIINDSSYVFFNDRSEENEINITKNYGFTFKPTQTTKYDSTYPIKMQLDEYITNGVFYLDSTGKGFLGGIKFASTDINNLAVTRDGGKTYEFISDNDLTFGYMTPYLAYYSSNVVSFDEKFIFYNNDDSRINKNQYRNILYYIDTNFNETDYLSYDSLFIVHYIIARNIDHFYLLTTTNDKSNIFDNRFEIKETLDGGKSYKTILSLERELNLIQIYEHNKDSVFFISENPTRLFLYDLTRDVIDTLYKNEKSEHLFIMYLSGQFYLLGKNLFIVNSNRNDLTQWTEADWDYGTPSFEEVVFKGDVALAKLSDSLRPLNYYRIMKSKPTPVEEQKSEMKYYTRHFYASPPYPIPGKTTIRTKVSWDMSFELEEAISGIYDIYGDRIQDQENINVKILGKAPAELIWNCSSVSSGLYFILIKHNGRIDSVPVLVEK